MDCCGFCYGVFIPVSLNSFFYVGIVCTLIGIAIVGLSFYSFSQKAGLTTANIHKYSRNPNYLGIFVFIGGLTVMGWSISIASIAYLLYFVYTLFYLHWVVLQEEKFLTCKYGDEFRKYLKKTPRYLGLPKN